MGRSGCQTKVEGLQRTGCQTKVEGLQRSGCQTKGGKLKMLVGSSGCQAKRGKLGRPDYQTTGLG